MTHHTNTGLRIGRQTGVLAVVPQPMSQRCNIAHTLGQEGAAKQKRVVGGVDARIGRRFGQPPFAPLAKAALLHGEREITLARGLHGVVAATRDAGAIIGHDGLADRKMCARIGALQTDQGGQGAWVLLPQRAYRQVMAGVEPQIEMALHEPVGAGEFMPVQGLGRRDRRGVAHEPAKRRMRFVLPGFDIGCSTAVAERGMEGAIVRFVPLARVEREPGRARGIALAVEPEHALQGRFQSTGQVTGNHVQHRGHSLTRGVELPLPMRLGRFGVQARFVSPVRGTGVMK